MAIIGAGGGYAISKIVKHRKKIKKLEKEFESLKTPKGE